MMMSVQLKTEQRHVEQACITRGGFLRGPPTTDGGQVGSGAVLRASATSRRASGGAALAAEGTEAPLFDLASRACWPRLRRACACDRRIVRCVAQSLHLASTDVRCPMRMSPDGVLGALLRKPAPPPKQPTARERTAMNRLHVLQTVAASSS